MTPAYQPDKAATEEMTAQISADTLPIEHKLHFQRAAARVQHVCLPHGRSTGVCVGIDGSRALSAGDGVSVKFEVLYLSFVILRQSH